MRPLIVVGFSARALGCSAVRARYQPYAIDLFADRDLAALGPAVKIARYPRGFVRALAAAPDAPWLFCGGLENYPRVVDRLAALRPLFGNRGDVLRHARDLDTMRLAADESGCRFPPTYASRALFEHAGEGADGKRWLVKPRHSGGGINIRFASASADDPPRGCYLQQHIAGEAASAVFVASAREARLLGATRQLVGADFGLDRPFVYAGSLGPLALPIAEQAKLTALGNALARRCGLAGLFNVDFVRMAGEIWPLEVNPRYSASVEVLEAATGMCAVSLHIAACQERSLAAVTACESLLFAGKAICYASHDVIIPPSLDDMLLEFNRANEPPQIADLPRVGARFSRGEPVLTVLAQAASPAEVETTLRTRLSAIHRLLTPDS